MKNLAGRPKVTITDRQRNKVVKMTNNKIFPGFRAIGRTIDHDSKIVQENGISIAKRRKIPKRTDKQIETQIQRLPLLRRALRGSILIIDDESYFDLDGHEFFGGQFYSFKNSPESVPEEIRYRSKVKYGKKLLIWVAISKQGVSRPYFHECLGAMNANIYIENCIRDRLVPFINLHDKKKVVFGLTSLLVTMLTIH